ncbi:glucan endo-1,3-beta-glucosidase-like isoform X2 [Diospyros lotus]|uniref:glucan endo-1,3-beta-glucosidase-like isoform X2 n=1 Tax=Diospyros lotus TaxID=55363 RepID=UPI00224F1341|nr:glucan endo-1,3-beta-glucosidase-like isoform X2 [Diospyros lotus]
MAVSSAASLILLVTLISCLEPTIVQGLEGVGVCNGRHANDLPSEQEVVEFYKDNGIGKMRIYGDPNQATLNALRSSGIQLILDVPNPDLEALAMDASSAKQWVQTNVVNFFPDVNFRYISVGNEVNPNGVSSRFTQFVLPAMKNIHDALAAASLGDQIKVSTATYMALIGNSYPPSEGSFSDDAKTFLAPIIDFLGQTRAPLLANIYPYFAYHDDTQNIQLPYALFTAAGVVVQDGEFGYQNLFDAMVDTMHAAVERAGGGAMQIVVSESGWPSEGGTGATMENAATYYRNLIEHVRGSGTPMRPGNAIETYLFAMFDENQKDGDETERHFGLFYPNKQPKYQLNDS